jgi:hypothetical protein
MPASDLSSIERMIHDQHIIFSQPPGIEEMVHAAMATVDVHSRHL